MTESRTAQNRSGAYTLPMDTEPSADLDLRRYLDGLRRRKFAVLAVTLLAVVTAVAISVTQKPLYAATADVLLQPSGSSSIFAGTSGQQVDATLLIDTEIKVIQGQPLRAEVARRLGPVRKVSAHRVDKTLIIAVTGFSRSAHGAATVANTYANSYIETRRQHANDDLVTAGTALQQKLNDLQNEIDQIDKNVNDAGTTQRDALRSSTAAQRASLVAQQGLFRQRLDELQVDAQVRSTDAHVLAAASAPASPIRPTPVRNVILAIAVGLLFGVGIACLREYLDDSVRTKDELAKVAGLPVLGTIPVFRASRMGFLALVGTSSVDSARAAEAYRALRTSVQLMGVARPLTTILFTSPSPGEGKTTTVANLATVLAAAGQRVAVVDSDLRRPRVHELFDLPNDRGVTSVLTGESTLEDALQPIAGQQGLHVLTAGAVAPNPSELLSLKRTSELVFRLQSTFDVVLIDSPPVLPVTDAIVMSAWVEAVVLVASSGTSRRQQVRTALELLRQAKAPVVGTVLGRTPSEPRYGYSYAYAAPPRSRGMRHPEAPPTTNGSVGLPEPVDQP